MARKKSETKKTSELAVKDYRHKGARRKNIPPAGLAAQGDIREKPKIQYFYNPHLPPVLRFDQTGGPDKLPKLLEISKKRPLTSDEAALLANALEVHEPWLEWSGKREKKSFEVDPVALHIHERISAQAILKVIAREDVQRSLFADPQLEYQKAIQFYQHDVDWSNRMILGDSLQVMASLARREDLAGKVQMIYMDPPYGIKFASNFQPEIGKRDVKDKETDLTREPEMVKAYRDTWTLGVHSYLSYLRDRLLLCKELLQETGSIFVQISDENLHLVRCLMDEVFGERNFINLITFVKTGGFASEALKSICDYIIWYSKNSDLSKISPIYHLKGQVGKGSEKYNQIELPDGYRGTFASLGLALESELPTEARQFREDNATSQGNPLHPIELNGKIYEQPWKTNPDGVKRLRNAERLIPQKNKLGYIRYLDDFGATEVTNVWTDIGGIQSRLDPKIYVVQTATEAIKRCLILTTNPGDLVLDPTCGSGTTAFVAEQWGRRWITIDTSRVALALARQRLLTASFPFYKVKNAETAANGANGGTNPERGFNYKTVPHITLKSIAQNVALDPIFAKHQPILDERLTESRIIQ